MALAFGFDDLGIQVEPSKHWLAGAFEGVAWVDLDDDGDVDITSIEVDTYARGSVGQLIRHKSEIASGPLFHALRSALLDQYGDAISERLVDHDRRHADYADDLKEQRLERWRHAGLLTGPRP
jgi:hypothetical protein